MTYQIINLTNTRHIIQFIYKFYYSCLLAVHFVSSPNKVCLRRPIAGQRFLFSPLHDLERLEKCRYSSL